MLPDNIWTKISPFYADISRRHHTLDVTFIYP
jgi:hypothetical protein